MQIYKVTNIVNDRFYIGKEKRNNKNYLGSGIMINNAIKKYGRENFKKEIIQVYETEEELNNAERYWIKELNSFYPIGYNIGEGGEGGDNISKNPNKDNIRKKMSLASKGKSKSVEHRKKMSIVTKERNLIGTFGMKGKHHTPETRKKIREANKGKHHTSESKQKMKEKRKLQIPPNKGKKFNQDWCKNISLSKIGNKSHLGYKHTDESKEKMSKKLKGRISPMKGKQFSIEHRKKLSESHKGKHHTPESIEKIKESMKMRFIPYVSPETRLKMGEARKGKKYKKAV